MRNYKAILFIVSFPLVFSASIAGQELFDSVRTVQYADYLYKSGGYLEAIDEYERYVFQFSAGENEKLRLVTSYRKSGMSGMGYFRMYELWDNPAKVSPPVAKEFYGLKIINSNFNSLFEDITENRVLDSNDKVFLSTAFFLLVDDYASAKNTLSTIRPTNNFALNAFDNLANEGLSLKHKSPLLSGTFSTFLPGSGKVYTGHWQDGLLSFVMVGSLVWQSYRGFEKNEVNSAYGWVFGTIGMGFYIGNITGSIKAAHKHNLIKRERIRTNAEAIFINNL